MPQQLQRKKPALPPGYYDADSTAVSAVAQKPAPPEGYYDVENAPKEIEEPKELGILDTINQFLQPKRFSEKGEELSASGKFGQQAAKMTGSDLVGDVVRRTTALNPVPSNLHEVGEKAKAIGRGAMFIPNLLSEVLRGPESEDELKAFGAGGFGGQGAVALHRLIAKPAVEGVHEIEQGAADVVRGGGGVAHPGVGRILRGMGQAAVPLGGSMARDIGQSEEQGQLPDKILEYIAAGETPKLAKAGLKGLVKEPTRAALQGVTDVSRPIKQEIGELRNRVGQTQALTERAKMAKEAEFEQRYRPIEEVASKELGAITTHGELANLLSGSFEGASSVPIRFPQVLMNKLIGEPNLAAGEMGQPFNFQQLRVVYRRLGSELRKTQKGTDLYRGLENARNQLDNLLRESAQKAGQERPYASAQTDYFDFINKGLGNELVQEFLETPSTAKRIQMLRNPEVMRVLQESGVDISSFAEAENLGLTTKGVPGMAMDAAEAEAMIRPEGGPGGMKALSLRRMAAQEEKYGANVGHLAYPSGRLRWLWRFVLSEPMIKFIAGAEEAAAPKKPGYIPPSRQLPPPRNVIKGPEGSGDGGVVAVDNMAREFDALAKRMPREVISGERPPTPQELEIAFAALREEFPQSQLLEQAKIQLGGDVDPFSLQFGGGFQEGAPSALPPEVRVAMEQQARTMGRALPEGMEPKGLPPGPEPHPFDPFNTVIEATQARGSQPLPPYGATLPESFGAPSAIPLGGIPKEPLEFAHFSTMKPPKGEVVVSGSRRSGMREMRAVGAEHKRLSEGRRVGGEFSPVPAVNVYPKGQVGEPHIMAGSSELVGRGDYALLDVAKNPLWKEFMEEGRQKAKEAGHNDTMSDWLSQNYAERKVMEAGYDGIRSSERPQLGTVLFNDVKMYPKGMEPPVESVKAPVPLPEGPKTVSGKNNAAQMHRERFERMSRETTEMANDAGAAFKIKQLHKDSGGATFNMKEGNLAGKDYFAVSTFPERAKVISGEVSTTQIEGFIKANKDLLKDESNSVGTWFDKESGKTHLDIVKTLKDKSEAISLAEKHKQLATFDLKTMQEIRTPVKDSIAKHIEELGAKASKRLKNKSFRSHAGIDPTMLGDAAIVGAVEIWKGGRSFNKWSRQMIDRFGPEVIPHLKQLYPKSQAIMWKKIDDGSAQHFITPSQVQKYIKKGEALKNWYRDKEYGKLLKEHFGDDADIVKAFAAILSQGTSLKTNVTLALKAYGQWKVGEAPNKLFLGRKNIERFLAGEKVKGMKIGTFAKQSGSKIPVEHIGEGGVIPDVVVDRRMAWGFGIGKQGGSAKTASLQAQSSEMLMPSTVGRKFIAEAISQMGKKYNMKPDQAQASFWKTIGDMRAEQGFGEYTSEPFSKIFGEHLDKLDKKPRFQNEAPLPSAKYGFKPGPATAERGWVDYLPKEVKDAIKREKK